MGQDGNESRQGGTRRAKVAQKRDSELARDIDANLKRVYAAALEEKVPDRFTELLRQLREKEGKA